MNLLGKVISIFIKDKIQYDTLKSSKMICVNNKCSPFISESYLTIGKIYEVYPEDKLYVSLYDDYGCYLPYSPRSNFMDIESFREKKINEILNGR